MKKIFTKITPIPVKNLKDETILIEVVIKKNAEIFLKLKEIHNKFEHQPLWETKHLSRCGKEQWPMFDYRNKKNELMNKIL